MEYYKDAALRRVCLPLLDIDQPLAQCPVTFPAAAAKLIYREMTAGLVLLSLPLTLPWLLSPTAPGAFYYF